jgi:hypothetical protein
LNTLKPSRTENRDDRSARRPSASFLVSLALHVALAVVFVRFLVAPSEFLNIFGHRASEPVPVERIGFLALPKAKEKPVEGRSGGDNRPAIAKPPRRLVAPSVVPSQIPPPPTTPAPAAVEEGSGPLVGSGGPAKGIRPTYADPRLWPAPGDIVAAPKTPTQRLDSVIATIIQPFNDTLAARAAQRQPGDWTIEKDGRKYGIDQKYIHLGKAKIPTAILALLPLNLQANPIVSERNRIQNQLHSDIMSQAQRGMNEADFRKAVRSIRERKERERAAEEAKKKGPADQPAPSSGASRN